MYVNRPALLFHSKIRFLPANNKPAYRIAMKKGLFVFIISITLIITSTAGAAHPAFYLGLGIGHSSFDFNNSNIVSDFRQLSDAGTISDDATTFDFYGGIPLDEFLSLEFDLVLAGDVTAREAGRSSKLFDVSTFDVTAMLSKQVSANTRMFGRLGAHMWDISESGGALDTINNAVDVTFGLGADINLYGSTSRQLRVQWNHYRYDGIYIEDNNILSISLLFEIGGHGHGY